MASTTRPRGRPRKTLDSINSSPAPSRSSSTRRSLRLAADEPVAVGGGRSTRRSTIVIDNEASSGISSASLSKVKSDVAVSSRTSLSSASAMNDSASSSGYSTPATSAITTPASIAVETKPRSTRRGRRSAPDALDGIAQPTVTLASRARALRNSEFSMNPRNKRKRGESDDEELELDNTADAQLARALQDEEDALAVTLVDETTMEVDTPNTTSRNLRRRDFSSSSIAKKPKIELNSQGSNSVSYKKKTASLASDSEGSDADEDEVFEPSDSDFESDAPLSRKLKKRPMIIETLASDSESDVPLSARQRKPMAKTSTKTNAPSKTGGRPGRRRNTRNAVASDSALTSLGSTPLTFSEFDQDAEGAKLDSELESEFSSAISVLESTSEDGSESEEAGGNRRPIFNRREYVRTQRALNDRKRLEAQHPELMTMWKDLENMPKIESLQWEQPKNISRQLKPFQLEGVAWMRAMEKTEWGGGLLGDEMGMGKTIQAVSLIMSDFPAKQPSLVLIPPVALMQWQQEIADYTDGTLKTFVFHGTNAKTRSMTVKDLKKYDVILMSYNSLESMYRKQEKGFKRKDGIHKEESVIHQIRFHRVILDEAHNIKQRTCGCAKACFALKADHKWCLTGTPLQNRIGEFFSLVRFLNIQPFSCYFCRQCPCSTMEWEMDENNHCRTCNHNGMQHVSVFNQELLNPIQKHGNSGPGKEAFAKLRLLTDRFMLRRVKRDHSSAMELPAKEIYVDRQFFGEEENDFASSIMNNSNRRFETYVAQGVLLNNYANIFGLIMQMRQVADHPDLILKKNGEGGQNILVCCVCDETAEEAIRSACRHDFCRECARNYLSSTDSPDCPQCHIPLSIDLEQPDIEQDEQLVKKSSIINRIKMENWTSSSKIETLVHDLHELRSHNSSSKSIIFSQFTTMLQLVEWRLRRAGITTVMLDGSMTPAQRQASINHFMTNVDVECFLVSLKAGGVALNLTEASKVFIVDPWWNPAAEWQSADRCHRIGQSRPCSITRLCIEDSVESRMVLLQEKKANMIKSTINADETAMESLTPEDMQFLFRGT
ncbi:SNF2 family N-terminal domain-containing protein [Xylogone sp. PMI_703]|nr:SNF2 family N-terminal domain-containing protein [Xylogone sp. PMI_703]